MNKQTEMSNKQKQLLSNMVEVIQSRFYDRARRRVIRQLVESLIYEELITPIETVQEGNIIRYEIKGRTAAGEEVMYVAYGEKKNTFGRIRLHQTKYVARVVNDMAVEVTSISLFLEEIEASFKHAPKQLNSFIFELEQTCLKDAQSLYARTYFAIADGKRSYAQLEGDMIAGHLYHPSYKSRIGFHFHDNVHFGPEFHPQFRLIWVAVKRESLHVSQVHSLSKSEFLKEQLGEKGYHMFLSIIDKCGEAATHYEIIPVHPWQWKQILSLLFIQLRNKDILYLGEGGDFYQPQQSIRTLSNIDNERKPYAKVALQMINTSARRIIAPHHVKNAAPLSEWLAEITKKDAVLQKEYPLVFLKEVFALTYKEETFEPLLRDEVYGSLGVIWRESVVPYLEKEEEALPCTALCHLTLNELPFVHKWIKQYGLREWVKQLVNVIVLPLVHLLYAHGVATEAHGQNLILLHKEGWPTRLVMRDLPGGVRIFQERHLFDSSPLPLFTHAQETRMVSGQANDVKDFLLDGFFHINLGEFALFLEEHYSLSERSFWRIVVERLEDYQLKHGSLQKRFSLFSLTAPTIEIGKLTSKRLFGDEAKPDHTVFNPLSLFNLTQKGNLNGNHNLKN